MLKTNYVTQHQYLQRKDVVNFFTENLTQLPNCREVFDSLDKWKMNLQTHYAFALSNEQLISHRDLILKSAANFLASNCDVEFKITIK